MQNFNELLIYSCLCCHTSWRRKNDWLQKVVKIISTYHLGHSTALVELQCEANEPISAHRSSNSEDLHMGQ